MVRTRRQWLSLLAALVIEPTGCKCPPRRALMMRALKSFANTAHLDRGFVVDWDTGNTCRVTEAPPLAALSRLPLLGGPIWCMLARRRPR